MHRAHRLPRQAHRLPTVLASLTPAAGLGSVAPGWGDVWMDDRWGERLLRLDGGAGRVVAAIPVQGRLSLAAGAGAMWALQSGGGYGRGLRGPLLRIDPRTNRVTARVPLRTPAGAVLGFGVLAEGRSVWVWGPRDVLRIDALTNRVAQDIEVGDQGGEVTGLAVRGRQLIVTTADGHLLRLDARTGARLAAIELALTAPALRIDDGRRLLITSRGVLAAADPSTGRLAWRRALGFRIGAVVEADGVLWTHGAAVEDPGDRLWAIDPRTGRVVGSALLPAFGTTGLALVNGTLWVASAGGRVLVIRRWIARRLRI